MFRHITAKALMRTYRALHLYISANMIVLLTIFSLVNSLATIGTLNQLLGAVKLMYINVAKWNSRPTLASKWTLIALCLMLRECDSKVLSSAMWAILKTRLLLINGLHITNNNLL